MTLRLYQFVFWTVLCFPKATLAFLMIQPTTVTCAASSSSASSASSSTSSTCLFMGKVKRGKLAKNVDGATPSRPRKKSKSKAAKKATNGAADAAAAAVSPDLAKWMASQQQQQQPVADGTTPTTDTTNVDEATMIDQETATTAASTFQSFSDEDSKKMTSKKVPPRRVRQSERMAAEQAMAATVQSYVTKIQDLLGIVVQEDDEDDDDDKRKKPSAPKQTDLPALLTTLRQLVSQGTTTVGSVKQLTAASNNSRKQKDYRLAWVGSDEAICHVGTGLHKVPLARLQEVFLTLPGKNQVVLQEVIRILGPFPNVRNTLQGTCRPSTAKNENNDGRDVVDWNWTWESMVDGTGKEILAGKEENTRDVPLNVHFASEAIVVASVPDEDNEMADPFTGDGKNILLFLREDDLQTSLEKLRVA